jgi:RNA-binding protein Musashi
VGGGGAGGHGGGGMQQRGGFPGNSNYNNGSNNSNMMGGGRPKNENCKVFVGGLPNGLTEDDIKQFFSHYGPVKDFKMYFDEVKQKPKGNCPATFFFRYNITPSDL